MFRRFCRAKIHNATVTAVRPDYAGSLAIDGKLLDAAGIKEMEMVHVFNSSNGNRFETYAVRGEAGKIEVLGAAARLCATGDRIIIVAEALVEEKDFPEFEPKIVFVDGENRMEKLESKKVNSSDGQPH